METGTDQGMASECQKYRAFLGGALKFDNCRDELQLLKHGLICKDCLHEAERQWLSKHLGELIDAIAKGEKRLQG